MVTVNGFAARDVSAEQNEGPEQTAFLDGAVVRRGRDATPPTTACMGGATVTRGIAFLDDALLRRLRPRRGVRGGQPPGPPPRPRRARAGPATAMTWTAPDDAVGDGGKLHAAFFADGRSCTTQDAGWTSFYFSREETQSASPPGATPTTATFLHTLVADRRHRRRARRHRPHRRRSGERRAGDRDRRVAPRHAARRRRSAPPTASRPTPRSPPSAATGDDADALGRGPTARRSPGTALDARRVQRARYRLGRPPPDVQTLDRRRRAVRGHGDRHRPAPRRDGRPSGARSTAPRSRSRTWAAGASASPLPQLGGTVGIHDRRRRWRPRPPASRRSRLVASPNPSSGAVRVALDLPAPAPAPRRGLRHARPPRPHARRRRRTPPASHSFVWDGRAEAVRRARRSTPPSPTPPASASPPASIRLR